MKGPRRKGIAVYDRVKDETFSEINVVKPGKRANPDDKGEQCIYCGKDSWTCEHYIQNTEPFKIEVRYSLRDDGRSDGQGESYAERNT